MRLVLLPCLASMSLPLLGVACGGDDRGDTSGATSTTDAVTSTDGDAGGTADPPGTDGPGGTSDSSGGPPATDGTADATDGSSSGGPPVECEGMSFFATSSGSGALGGNLGGLAGADAICQMHADAVGQGGCTWHAYLSASAEDARDRIGSGPWTNAAGETIAQDVASLHADGLSNGMPQHVLDENGDEVPGAEHDILTGSEEDGTLRMDATCDDWTSDTQDFVARVGHSDIPPMMFSPSWNSAHDTPGCRPQDLESTGGAGRLYCFAID